MQRQHSSRRGFTLLEMMMVVAIVGAMSALAVSNIQNIVDRGRINGTSRSLAQVLANARVKAMAMSCPIGVQINGPLYAPGTPLPEPMPKAGLVVFRKSVCDPAAPVNGWFETGDQVIQTLPMDWSKRIDVKMTGVISSNAGVLGNSAAVVIWSMSGGVLKRDVYEDSSGSGTFNLATVNGTDLTIDVSDGTNTMYSQMLLPDKGAPHLP